MMDDHYRIDAVRNTLRTALKACFMVTLGTAVRDLRVGGAAHSHAGTPPRHTRLQARCTRSIHLSSLASATLAFPAPPQDYSRSRPPRASGMQALASGHVAVQLMLYMVHVFIYMVPKRWIRRQNECCGPPW